MTTNTKENVADGPLALSEGRKSIFGSVWEEAKKDLSQSSDLRQLEIESLKIGLKLREMEASAKVEQEIAIARRIANAEEVEIEEYYDTMGSANLGLSTDKVISFGGSASARLVSRRIIRFRGGATIFKSEAHA